MVTEKTHIQASYTKRIRIIYTIPDFQVVPNTTNSQRNVDIDAKKCMIDENNVQKST